MLALFTFVSLAPGVDLVFVELEAYTVLSVLFKKEEYRITGRGSELWKGQVRGPQTKTK